MTMVAPLPKLSGADIEKLVQNADARGTVDAAANGHDSVMEPKLDGWRTVWTVEDDGQGGRRTRFFTRSGNELTGRMPAVEAEISEVFPPGSIIDAEVVAFNVADDGSVTHTWNTVQSCLSAGVAKARLTSGALTLAVFDLIRHGEVDARQLPLRQRRQALEAIFDKHDFQKVILIPQIPATDESHAALIAAGYEGSMVKWQDARYGSGKRGAGWWKLKPQATVDVVVMGYKPGEGSFEGLVGAIEFGQHDENGKLVYRGRCSGMTLTERYDFTERADDYLGTVIEVAHMGLMAESKDYPMGAFRHPQFKRTRPDRSPESVVRHDG